MLRMLGVDGRACIDAGQGSASVTLSRNRVE
jgi:hypothetical protein